MLVFIDESGCTGFKFGKGSSNFFLVTMVFFDDNKLAEATSNSIKELRDPLNWSKEFHFKELPDKVKQAFYDKVISNNFFYRSIVIDKRLIYSDYLKGNKKKFYNYIVGQMVAFDGGYLKDAKVIVDNSCDNAFKTELKVYMRKKARENGYTIKDIKFKDWRQNSLVQVPDMICGALFRKFERNDSSYYKQVRKRENNLWRFK
ncbi:DUF3800 domain-containing protein [Alkalihalobacillus sp. BA299]|uniref:DUF3800 domain-containing protein n=1 Tax=Alkalihalobacillus sp. BA299 TaxID=2815938 RepID=UPI001ADA85AE|nr:DUF3800 domain-containing protein [Alkalihalobacillus sp. BA299]